MTLYKHILVQLETPETADQVLNTAHQVAVKFTSHLDVVHVHQEPSCLLPMPVVSSDIAGFVVNDVVEVEERAFAKAADKVRNKFEHFLERNGVKPQAEANGNREVITAEFREIYGCVQDIFAWCSRVCDLTVLPRLEAQTGTDSFITLNAVLMESGSAVLVCPKTPSQTLATKIAIVWDGSEESAKAVTFAMPFLVKAHEVVILETATPNEDFADARALANRLAWHGVETSFMKLPEFVSVNAQGSEMIKQTCGRFDLVVMGAYTQSTMRRLILGSITKYMVENADIALFLAH